MPLLTHEEYEVRAIHPPYAFTVEGDNKSLFYFGERHSFDPDLEQWEDACNFWGQFVSETRAPRLALCEGSVPRGKYASHREAIARAGGPGLVAFLGRRDRVQVESPEPDFAYELLQLEKRFPRLQIQYYYFARAVAQWHRLPEPRPELAAYVAPFLRRPHERAGWTPVTLADMRRAHETFMGVAFDERDASVFAAASQPLRLTNPGSEVARASSELRDRYVVQQIAEYWRLGYALYAHYGFTHAVMQEPALREQLN